MPIMLVDGVDIDSVKKMLDFAQQLTPEAGERLNCFLNGAAFGYNLTKGVEHDGADEDGSRRAGRGEKI